MEINTPASLYCILTMMYRSDDPVKALHGQQIVKMKSEYFHTQILKKLICNKDILKDSDKHPQHHVLKDIENINIDGNHNYTCMFTYIITNMIVITTRSAFTFLPGSLPTPYMWFVIMNDGERLEMFKNTVDATDVPFNVKFNDKDIVSFDLFDGQPMQTTQKDNCLEINGSNCQVTSPTADFDYVVILSLMDKSYVQRVWYNDSKKLTLWECAYFYF
ncbi:hypothetical protein OAB94_02720 [Flavobacteriaceae bacterium]|nr:hypothetical protein [Flavobacteriaceae bacterium]